MAEYDRIAIHQLRDATGLPVANDINFKPFVQTISTSIVYRFNWGGPVGPRY